MIYFAFIGTSWRKKLASKHFKYGFFLAGIYEPFIKVEEADILWRLQKG